MSGSMGTDEQELRVAVVMNGGVSLAVWMGGVTLELDRLRRREGPYGSLATLTRTLPRVDVIAGSSAGGINGAVLAVAIARGSHVRGIRDIWMEQGSIIDLLRDPRQRQAPSLFRGDLRLLTGLGSALRDVASKGVPGSVDDQPLHLTVTGTLLEGEVKAYADHFGAVVPDVDHRARFVFRRGKVGEVPEAGTPWPDSFAGEVALDRVALAARSSASFPVAFEPSFCPVAAPGADDAHPDMAAAANFSQSRWVIDGGVLVNTPFRPALDAIATLGAERPVRRVLAYVVPHPVAATPAPDTPGEVRTALEVAMDAGSRIPRVQSIGRELEQIADNNKQVAKRRKSRRCTLDDLDSEQLEAAARALLGAYLCVRREVAVADIVDRVLAGRQAVDDARWRSRKAADPDAPRDAPWREAPSIEQVDALRDALRTAGGEPWLPDPDPATAFWGSVRDWRWGLAPVEHAGNLALDLLRSAVEELDGSRAVIMELRGRLHEQLAALRRAKRHNEEYWGDWHPLLDDVARVPEAVAGWGELADEAASIAREVARILVEAGDAVASEGGADHLAARVRTIAAPLDAAEPAEEAALRRLVSLDVIQRASGADLAGTEQAIELVLMSADAENAFDPRKTAQEKLAGLQVAHFGSFYKRSWRANDWMWGRLDGADRVARTLLDPSRIRLRLDEPGTTPDAILAEIRAIAAPERLEADSRLDESGRRWLSEAWEARADALDAEVRALAPDPASTDLPLCHEAIRRRLQLEIVCDEIAGVRDAAAADAVAGASRRTQGWKWQAGLPKGPLDGQAAIAAFTGCRIGTETLADDAGSDHFTGVATTALGVTGSVLGGAVTWKPLQPVLNTVRGVFLALYLLGRGVVSGSRTGAMLVALVLALGGALIALSLLGVDVPGLLTLLGATLLVAGVLLGAVRQTWLRIAFVLVLYAATVVAYYVVHSWDDQPAWVDPVAVTAAITLLAAGATVLGYRNRSPASG